jgi:hypothetical protein
MKSRGKKSKPQGGETIAVLNPKGGKSSASESSVSSAERGVVSVGSGVDVFFFLINMDV